MHRIITGIGEVSTISEFDLNSPFYSPSMSSSPPHDRPPQSRKNLNPSAQDFTPFIEESRGHRSKLNHLPSNDMDTTNRNAHSRGATMAPSRADRRRNQHVPGDISATTSAVMSTAAHDVSTSSSQRWFPSTSNDQQYADTAQQSSVNAERRSKQRRRAGASASTDGLGVPTPSQDPRIASQTAMASDRSDSMTGFTKNRGRGGRQQGRGAAQSRDAHRSAPAPSYDPHGTSSRDPQGSNALSLVSGLIHATPVESDDSQQSRTRGRGRGGNVAQRRQGERSTRAQQHDPPTQGKGRAGRADQAPPSSGTTPDHLPPPPPHHHHHRTTNGDDRPSDHDDDDNDDDDDDGFVSPTLDPQAVLKNLIGASQHSHEGMSPSHVDDHSATDAGDSDHTANQSYSAAVGQHETSHASRFVDIVTEIATNTHSCLICTDVITDKTYIWTCLHCNVIVHYDCMKTAALGDYADPTTADSEDGARTRDLSRREMQNLLADAFHTRTGVPSTSVSGGATGDSSTGSASAGHKSSHRHDTLRQREELLQDSQYLRDAQLRKLQARGKANASIFDDNLDDVDIDRYFQDKAIRLTRPFSCPTCFLSYTTFPSLPLCFCQHNFDTSYVNTKKQYYAAASSTASKDESASDAALLPHSCGNPCGRPLSESEHYYQNSQFSFKPLPIASDADEKARIHSNLIDTTSVAGRSKKNPPPKERVFSLTDLYQLYQRLTYLTTTEQMEMTKITQDDIDHVTEEQLATLPPSDHALLPPRYACEHKCTYLCHAGPHQQCRVYISSLAMPAETRTIITNGVKQVIQGEQTQKPIMCACGTPTTIRCTEAHARVQLLLLEKLYGFQQAIHDPRVKELFQTIPLMYDDPNTPPAITCGEQCGKRLHSRTSPTAAHNHATTLQDTLQHQLSFFGGAFSFSKGTPSAVTSGRKFTYTMQSPVLSVLTAYKSTLQLMPTNVFIQSHITPLLQNLSRSDFPDQLINALENTPIHAAVRTHLVSLLQQQLSMSGAKQSIVYTPIQRYNQQPIVFDAVRHLQRICMLIQFVLRQVVQSTPHTIGNTIIDALPLAFQNLYSYDFSQMYETLPCQHTCTHVCHFGACPPCSQMVYADETNAHVFHVELPQLHASSTEVSASTTTTTSSNERNIHDMYRFQCHCGQASTTSLPCGVAAKATGSDNVLSFSCGGTCPKVHPCGHACTYSCHGGTCPPCVLDHGVDISLCNCAQSVSFGSSYWADHASSPHSSDGGGIRIDIDTPAHDITWVDDDAGTITQQCKQYLFTQLQHYLHLYTPLAVITPSQSKTSFITKQCTDDLVVCDLRCTGIHLLPDVSTRLPMLPASDDCSIAHSQTPLFIDALDLGMKLDQGACPHPCQLTCHRGDCLPCISLDDIPCRGGHSSVKVSCLMKNITQMTAYHQYIRYILDFIASNRIITKDAPSSLRDDDDDESDGDIGPLLIDGADITSHDALYDFNPCNSYVVSPLYQQRLLDYHSRETPASSYHGEQRSSVAQTGDQLFIHPKYQQRFDAMLKSLQLLVQQGSKVSSEDPLELPLPMSEWPSFGEGWIVVDEHRNFLHGDLAYAVATQCYTVVDNVLIKYTPLSEKALAQGDKSTRKKQGNAKKQSHSSSLASLMNLVNPDASTQQAKLQPEGKADNEKTESSESKTTKLDVFKETSKQYITYHQQRIPQRFTGLQQLHRVMFLYTPIGMGDGRVSLGLQPLCHRLCRQPLSCNNHRCLTFCCNSDHMCPKMCQNTLPCGHHHDYHCHPGGCGHCELILRTPVSCSCGQMVNKDPVFNPTSALTRVICHDNPYTHMAKACTQCCLEGNATHKLSKYITFNPSYPLSDEAMTSLMSAYDAENTPLVGITTTIDTLQNPYHSDEFYQLSLAARKALVAKYDLYQASLKTQQGKRRQYQQRDKGIDFVEQLQQQQQQQLDRFVMPTITDGKLILQLKLRYIHTLVVRTNEGSFVNMLEYAESKQHYYTSLVNGMTIVNQHALPHGDNLASGSTLPSGPAFHQPQTGSSKRNAKSTPEQLQPQQLHIPLALLDRAWFPPGSAYAYLNPLYSDSLLSREQYRQFNTETGRLDRKLSKQLLTVDDAKLSHGPLRDQYRHLYFPTRGSKTYKLFHAAFSKETLDAQQQAVSSQQGSSQQSQQQHQQQTMGFDRNIDDIIARQHPIGVYSGKHGLFTGIVSVVPSNLHLDHSNLLNARVVRTPLYSYPTAAELNPSKYFSTVLKPPQQQQSSSHHRQQSDWNPSMPSSPGEGAHQQVTQKLLHVVIVAQPFACTHDCDQPTCHSGRCNPCNQPVLCTCSRHNAPTQYLACNLIQSRVFGDGGIDLPVCQFPCHFTLPCGRHKCQKQCHHGACFTPLYSNKYITQSKYANRYYQAYLQYGQMKQQAAASKTQRGRVPYLPHPSHQLYFIDPSMISFSRASVYPSERGYLPSMSSYSSFMTTSTSSSTTNVTSRQEALSQQNTHLQIFSPRTIVNDISLLMAQSRLHMITPQGCTFALQVIRRLLTHHALPIAITMDAVSIVPSSDGITTIRQPSSVMDAPRFTFGHVITPMDSMQSPQMLGAAMYPSSLSSSSRGGDLSTTTTLTTAIIFYPPYKVNPSRDATSHKPCDLPYMLVSLVELIDICLSLFSADRHSTSIPHCSTTLYLFLSATMVSLVNRRIASDAAMASINGEDDRGTSALSIGQHLLQSPDHQQQQQQQASSHLSTYAFSLFDELIQSPCGMPCGTRLHTSTDPVTFETTTHECQLNCHPPLLTQWGVSSGAFESADNTHSKASAETEIHIPIYHIVPLDGDANGDDESPFSKRLAIELKPAPQIAAKKDEGSDPEHEHERGDYAVELNPSKDPEACQQTTPEDGDAKDLVVAADSIDTTTTHPARTHLPVQQASTVVVHFHSLSVLALWFLLGISAFDHFQALPKPTKAKAKLPAPVIPPRLYGEPIHITHETTSQHTHERCLGLTANRLHAMMEYLHHGFDIGVYTSLDLTMPSLLDEWKDLTAALQLDVDMEQLAYALSNAMEVIQSSNVSLESFFNAIVLSNSINVHPVSTAPAMDVGVNVMDATTSTSASFTCILSLPAFFGFAASGGVLSTLAVPPPTQAPSVVHPNIDTPLQPVLGAVLLDVMSAWGVTTPALPLALSLLYYLHEFYNPVYPRKPLSTVWVYNVFAKHKPPSSDATRVNAINTFPLPVKTTSQTSTDALPSSSAPAVVVGRAVLSTCSLVPCTHSHTTKCACESLSTQTTCGASLASSLAFLKSYVLLGLLSPFDLNAVGQDVTPGLGDITMLPMSPAPLDTLPTTDSVNNSSNKKPPGLRNLIAVPGSLTLPKLNYPCTASRCIRERKVYTLCRILNFSVDHPHSVAMVTDYIQGSQSFVVDQFVKDCWEFYTSFNGGKLEYPRLEYEYTSPPKPHELNDPRLSETIHKPHHDLFSYSLTLMKPNERSFVQLFSSSTHDRGALSPSGVNHAQMFAARGGVSSGVLPSASTNAPAGPTGGTFMMAALQHQQQQRGDNIPANGIVMPYPASLIAEIAGTMTDAYLTQAENYITTFLQGSQTTTTTDEVPSRLRAAVYTLAKSFHIDVRSIQPTRSHSQQMDTLSSSSDYKKLQLTRTPESSIPLYSIALCVSLFKQSGQFVCVCVDSYGGYIDNIQYLRKLAQFKAEVTVAANMQLAAAKQAKMTGKLSQFIKKEPDSKDASSSSPAKPVVHDAWGDDDVSPTTAVAGAKPTALSVDTTPPPVVDVEPIDDFDFSPSSPSPIPSPAEDVEADIPDEILSDFMDEAV